MEKISWKQELYFLRYSISKFRDFSRIFLEFFINFLGTFPILSIIMKMPLQFLRLKFIEMSLQFFNWKFIETPPPPPPPDFLSENLQKCPSNL